jgi:hypothetical protein
LFPGRAANHYSSGTSFSHDEAVTFAMDIAVSLDSGALSIPQETDYHDPMTAMVAPREGVFRKGERARMALLTAC